GRTVFLRCHRALLRANGAFTSRTPFVPSRPHGGPCRGMNGLQRRHVLVATSPASAGAWSVIRGALPQNLGVWIWLFVQGKRGGESGLHALAQATRRLHGNVRAVAQNIADKLAV